MGVIENDRRPKIDQAKFGETKARWTGCVWWRVVSFARVHDHCDALWCVYERGCVFSPETRPSQPTLTQNLQTPRPAPYIYSARPAGGPSRPRDCNSARLLASEDTPLPELPRWRVARILLRLHVLLLQALALADVVALAPHAHHLGREKLHEGREIEIDL